MPNKKLNSIQYLRAFAVLLVVYAHSIDLQMVYGVSWQQNFLYLQNFGAIGVDIFFIISGFIIAYIAGTKNGINESLIFIKNRFIRINPSYYLASILYVIITDITLGHRIYFPKFRSIKTITILPIFDSGTKFKLPLLDVVGWTLSFEWFFYVLYTFLIFFSIKKRNAGLLLLLTTLTIAGFFVPLHEVHYKFITNPIVLEFCLGVIIAQAYNGLAISGKLAKVFLFAGIGLYLLNIILGFGNVSESHFIYNPEKSWQRFFLWGIPSSFIVMGMLFIEKKSPKNIFSNRLLLLIGNASYSIYLVHLTFFLLVKWLFKYSPYLSKLISPDLLIFVAMIVGIGAGLIYYKYVENPMLKMFNKVYANTYAISLRVFKRAE